MDCGTCSYKGSAKAMVDSAGKPLNVCPACNTPIFPKAKPWEILNIPKARYLATRPWKAAKMSRRAFEWTLEQVTPEALDLLRREAEAEVLIEALGLEL